MRIATKIKPDEDYDKDRDKECFSPVLRLIVPERE